jgi:hypothetical protein
MTVNKVCLACQSSITGISPQNYWDGLSPFTTFIIAERAQAAVQRIKLYGTCIFSR